MASGPVGSMFVPRPRRNRDRAPSLIDIALAPAQLAAVTRPVGGSMLVLGEAGHGKTTVALHRLAFVWRAYQKARPTSSVRAAVVVPTEGLARLLQPLLRRLGIDVGATTYDAWAGVQARRAFRGLPPESDETPAVLARLKRAPALHPALEEVAAREAALVDDNVDEAGVRSGQRRVSRGDLQHLFGDRRIVQRLAEAVHVGPHAVLAMLDRTRIQFSATAEQEWEHVVERSRILAVDGRPLDERTAAANSRTIDVEDYAILFELERLRSARRGRGPLPVRTFDILVLDEAQEFAPLELSLLGRSLAEGGTLIVAGDADQQTDATTHFFGWDAVMRDLGPGPHETVRLDVGYRCPPGVVALARSLRTEAEPRTQAGPIEGAADVGAATAFLSFPDESTLIATMGPSLAALAESDRAASIAVVCRSAGTARRVTAALVPHTPARVVFDGRFLPRGPVQVTTVDEVKGLEFDYVIVPDATAREYPDDGASRRTLYVAVTRARHQLAIASTGERSPIVPWPAVP